MTTPPGKRIKVLVVDDSAIVRKVLGEAMSAEPDLEVVGTAPDPYIARDKILQLKPDVLTLDIEMPRMDGITFLRKVMQYHPLPVIIISSLGQASCEIAMEALRIGAVEVVAKPGGPYSVGELRTTLATKVRAAAAAKIQRRIAHTSSAPPPAPAVPVYAPVLTSAHAHQVIAIGASTGGTEAVRQVLSGLPANSPGVLITQHIPPIFSNAFAKRLNEHSALEVKEAENGDLILPGRALVAPGNFHMIVRETDGQLRVEVKDGPQVCYQRPAVDVTFISLANVAPAESVAVILTGMGSDGAQGIAALKRGGARTLAQDEASCVVFGMPRQAIATGAIDKVVPLSEMAEAIISQVAALPHRH